jgi:hypothetical protein
MIPKKLQEEAEELAMTMKRMNCIPILTVLTLHALRPLCDFLWLSAVFMHFLVHLALAPFKRGEKKNPLGLAKANPACSTQLAQHQTPSTALRARDAQV